MSIVFSQELKNVSFNKTYQIESEKNDLVGEKIRLTSKNEIIVLSEYDYGNSVINKYDFNGNEIWSKQFQWLKLNDIQIHNNELIVLGYHYLTGKVLLTKLDLNGNLIWEKSYKIKYSNKGEAFSISDNGDIYILSEIEKGRFPIQMSLKGGFKNLIRYVGRDPVKWENKLAIHKLDNNGNVKWKKVIGKRKSTYSATDIEVNNQNEICILSHTNFNSILNNPDTWIVKLNPNGDKVFETIIAKKYLESIHVHNENNFQMVGSNSEWKQFENDSIFIYELNQMNALKIFFKEKSIFDEISITSFDWDVKTQSYFIGGYGVNMKTKGIVWASHEDNWIGRLSINDLILREWSNKKKSIDRINDFAISENHIVTTGESWGRNQADEIFKEMRIMKIEK